MIVPAVSAISSTRITFFILDIADHSHSSHDIGLGTLFVTEHKWQVQILGVVVCTLRTTHVGCGDHHVLKTQRLDIGYEHRRSIKMVDRNIKKAQDDALRLFSGDGDPNEYLLQNYEYYVNQWLNQVPTVRKVAETPEDAGNLQSEDTIRMFILSFRRLSQTLATLKTFSKFSWDDLAIALDEDEYEAYKTWYLYFYDQAGQKNGKEKVPVPIDVDFDIELVRTDRINVIYILNLLKNMHRDSTPEERQRDIDLILREIERSDNEAMRFKKGFDGTVYTDQVFRPAGGCGYPEGI